MTQPDCGPSDEDVLKAPLARLRACRVCASELPVEPRPVFDDMLLSGGQSLQNTRKFGLLIGFGQEMHVARKLFGLRPDMP
jgi:hypothetical protein